MLMLIAILVKRKIVWQGSNKTGDNPYLHCVPSIGVKQEKKEDVEKIFFMIAKA